MQRRAFVNQSLLIAGSLITLPSLSSCQSNSREKSGNKTVDNNFNPDLDIRLTASPVALQILTGKATNLYSFKAELTAGKNEAIQDIENSYLGPIINVKRGEKVRIRFINEIERESIVHWHGLHVPPKMDGHPMYAVNPGEEFIYEFEVVDRAGTYWFHPHPDKITGPQVYQGLAGLFVVSDPEEEKLNLPSGNYDMPLIIQDRTFTADNQLVYGQENRMQMMGFLGDQILVNGKQSQAMEVEQATYRLRVLNGSNSRIYKLAWDNGEPITVIGADGGLLEKPEQLPYLMLAPGERYDLWIDFSNSAPGKGITLKSLSFNPGMMMHGMGMVDGHHGMGGMMGDSQSAIPLGSEFDIMSFKVIAQQGQKTNLPAALATINKYDVSTASNAGSPREFNFFMEKMQWTINGETFEMEAVADWEKVQLGTKEVWQFINANTQMGMMGNGGMMGQRGHGMMSEDETEGRGMNNMMQMPHPVHVHGLQFQIIERNAEDMDPAVWNSVKDGFVESGWQDTFLLMPDMKVKIMLEFKDFTGLYIYHCHNLEHEDMGMMRNYRVVEQ